MNTKEEFINTIKDYKLLCAKIQLGDCRRGDNEEEAKLYILPKDYTQEQYNDFLKQIDFNYDSGYGGQELYGIIRCDDGVWFDRGEYDGSEWRDYHKYPEIELDSKIFRG